MIRTPIGATVHGYPRIGRHRELKFALEGVWSGRTTTDQLTQVARDLRYDAWERMRDAGIDTVPVNTFSLYDHVLDAAVLVGAVPSRFAGLEADGPDVGGVDLRTYTAMARGEGSVAPLEMTKWFDTNYHYLVPEIGPHMPFRLAGDKPLSEYREATGAGLDARPVLVGPATFLLLAKAEADAPADFTPFDRLGDLVDVYAELLGALADAGVAWVQLDEPAFVADRTAEEIAALRETYDRLGRLEHRPGVFVASYFGELGDALPALAATPVEAIGVDLVAGTEVRSLAVASGLRDKTLVGGAIDGRNVWRADLESALSRLTTLLGIAGDVAVSTSCSLLHVPHDVTAEPGLDPVLSRSLAFADQKLAEVATLARALREGRDAVSAAFDDASDALRARAASAALRNDSVRERVARLGPDDARRVPYAERAAEQAARLGLPALPTTTIGSFPQTSEVRAVRAGWRAGRVDDATYTERMRTEIERVIRLQERLGLDVLVHGEPERNDMVQYFAEHLEGFTTTINGWVQSYGTRCVRPPILYGDVARARPITVEWATYAQSLTDRPVKGMLTGPVTILAWSFVRGDQPLGDTARQVALALRDEVAELEIAGIGIIQVDEPALRELLPLRHADQPSYLEWAVETFRLATSGVAPSTQIHTHLCYSEFGEVMSAIDALDADVTSIEAARSRMEIVPDIAASGFGRGIGPGVYDIHSPRVPEAKEIELLLLTALDSVPAERLWVNPDCGLKTRGYAEVEPALANLVAAANAARTP
ncbi:MAG TPA: 5-methyltetrahydropteroyltriglutamate--homocysteine S-methyltransferase [Jiangellaceae bacterium]